MKKILLTMVVIFTGCLVFSQDIIYLKNGTEIKAKIIEITDVFVKYKRFEQQEGPLRNLQISEVFMVIVNRKKKYSDFGKMKCSKFGNKSAVFSGTILQ